MTPVFVAIDHHDVEAARTLVRAVDGLAAGVKLGTEFCLRHGALAARRLLDGTDLRLFLDLKLHDIPETVSRSLAGVLPAEPDFVTLHLAGGKAMAAAALSQAEAAAKPPLLLAVTVLTSLDAAALGQIGLGDDPPAVVARWVALAHAWGLRGIVCSPQEIRTLRRDPANAAMTLVTPGIRPAWAGLAADDQQRTAEPAAALAAGADFLVIGRPVTRAADPRAAIRRIRDDIAAHLPQQRSLP